ncbi:hypothetical protein G4923_09165 [Aeromonas rivipollensis]|uniref:Tail fibre protein gp37 trimerization region domain-containing protein n=1 Tax=Aeromonas rivipollensis TaxID=948519 RepID=A0ABX0CY85_9GAMM|nr:hypothetical protein [Aeromonas rivipollensis]NEX88872.1 hypothetical protein [Aeromonas rivipollensis]NEY06976.1 hypothetical protein [Aeromonas rivipollensis]
MAKEKILDIIKSSKTIDSSYDIKLNKGQGTNAASATRKDYVDAQDALKLNKAGDTMTGNLSTPKVLLTAAQGAEANSVTRRDFVEATVTAAGSGKKDLTIALPSGAPATGYIPVSFNFGSASNSEIYINTRTDVGAAPMNNCSFNGIVRASGWSDASTYSTGFFTIHDLAERSLHSFQSCTENATNFIVAYVETRAFPINVRVDVGVSVTASATDVTFGTSVFKVNGQDGGNTKTAVIANFDKGSGYYNRSNRVYDTGYNPTPDAVGAVAKTGDTMTGNLTVNANINASNIFSTGSITANTISTFSGLRLSSNASGYSEIVPRRANEADYLWSNGIRYYDSNNYWAIGSNRILHDAYSPRLTSIENSLDLNTISVPVKTMSLAHFGSAATNKPNTSNSANSVVHISTWETGTYAHQLAFSSDGKIYNRYNNNVSWSDWGQVYTSIYKPTPAYVGAVNKTGDTMTGALTITNSNAGINLDPAANTPSYILGRQNSVNNWYVGKGSGTNNDIQLSSYIHNTTLALRSDRIESNKSFYVNTARVVTYADEAFWRNRSFLPDLGVSSAVLPGYFAFAPDALSSPDVTQYGHGFAVNPGSNGAQGIWSSQFAVTHVGTGKLWHRTGINGAAQGNWKKIYTSDDKPTPADLGAVDKAGDSMSGQLTLTPGFVDTSVNAQLAHIGKDATKALYIRNMREHNSSAWVWEKLYNGSLYYSSGVNGAGTNKIRLLVSGTGSGEIYLGTNADKRVYHEGFNPTAGDVGAVAKTGDTMTGNLTVPSVLVSSAQNTSVNALTRKDYVDAEVAKLLARIVALESK